MTISVLTGANATHSLASEAVSVNLFDSEGNIAEFNDKENPVEITIPLQVSQSLIINECKDIRCGLFLERLSKCRLSPTLCYRPGLGLVV